MTPRAVIVGGVAARMNAAMQVKRRRDDAEVIVLERGPFVAYGPASAWRWPRRCTSGGIAVTLVERLDRVVASFEPAISDVRRREVSDLGGK